MFPVISTIDDVLPHVAGRPDFVIAKKDGYTVIDYLYVDKDTFDHPIRQECRGIKFNADGTILARPFHKFFNVGEKDHPSDIDFSRPHVITTKLDGSMIHPAKVNGQWHLMTRMGATDVAKLALPYFTLDYVNFSDYCHSFENTPIFEFTSSANRVVLRYDSPMLTLLAIRNNTHGTYCDRKHIEYIASLHGIPVVPVHDFTVTDVDEFIQGVRNLIGQEGYVITFEDGTHYKIKADEYVLRHKALDGHSQTKKAVALVIDQLVDDTLPILAPEDAVELKTFADHLNAIMLRDAHFLSDFVEQHRPFTRKVFATMSVPVLPEHLRGAAFKVLDGHPPLRVIKDIYRKKPDLVPVKWRGL